MRASVICSLALAGFTLSAQAADLDLKALKDPLPDKLTWNGITVFGAIDVGYGYNSIGAPLNGSWLGLNNIVWGLPAGYKPISSLNTNAYDLTYIGVKLEEPLGYGWKVIGQLDTGFDPLTGKLDNACADIIRYNGLPGNQQGVWANSSRCGQIINGQAYAGVRNATYGTLTVGRQTPLALSKMYSYDPVALAAAFSLLGFSSGFGGATGVADTSKWNNSVKYANEYGPVHGAVMFAQGSQDGGNHGNAYGANLGATWHGLSVDMVYTYDQDAVSTTGYGVGGCGVAGTPSCNTLVATAQNTEAWSFMGKYAFDVTGAFKGTLPDAKLTLYAGYQTIEFSNPSDPISVGDTTNGGYVFGTVRNTVYSFGNKRREIGWVGARFETGPWTATVAYYLGHQGYFKNSATSTFCSDTSHSNCSGSLSVASTTVAYAFNKHLDLYAGVVWSALTGGMAVGYTTATAGYPTTPQATSFVTGMRFRF